MPVDHLLGAGVARLLPHCLGEWDPRAPGAIGMGGGARGGIVRERMGVRGTPDFLADGGPPFCCPIGPAEGGGCCWWTEAGVPEKGRGWREVWNSLWGSTPPPPGAMTPMQMNP